MLKSWINKPDGEPIDDDDNKRYLVGTNAYVAGGKDGYKTFGKLFNDPKYEGVDTAPDAESFIRIYEKTSALWEHTSSNVKFNASTDHYLKIKLKK